MAGNTSKAVLAVFNLSWTCMKKDLRSHFSKYGKVLFVQIPMDTKTGFNKKMGFVHMMGPDGFENKIYQDYHTIDHNEVKVKARERKLKQMK